LARYVLHPPVHGTPDTTPEKKGKDDKLKNHLIGLIDRSRVVLLLMLDHILIEIKASFSAVSPPPSTMEVLALTKNVKVLPSAPLRTLRLKLLKLFKAPRGTEGELWMRMADGNFVPLGGIGEADDDRDIDWWLESGSEVVLCTKN
jgi:tubulin-specific chaperone E